MKQIIVTIALIGLSIISAFGQEDCLNRESLKKLDASWEKAQLELNFHYIKSILAEEFI